MGGEPERDPEVSDLHPSASSRRKLFFSSPPSLPLESSRARSIYERALDVDHRNITLWLKYAEMEMKNRQVNHARNIWDRAITILPRVSQFWWVLEPLSYPKVCCKKYAPPPGLSVASALSSPVKVQVHLHGGDAGERGGLQAGV